MDDQSYDKTRVTFDPGHGGNQNGASYDNPNVLFDGLKEDDFNLGVALFAQWMAIASGRLLPHMTRDKDVAVSLPARVAAANDNGSHLFVSIHGDAFPDSPVTGHTVYYARDTSRPFADAVSMGLKVFFPNQKDRGVKEAPHWVTKHTLMPAVLVECGFVSTEKERMLMRRPDFQEQCALAIINGINLYISGV